MASRDFGSFSVYYLKIVDRKTYANISKDTDFDLMHILKNWGEHLLAILLGKRCNAPNLQRFLQKCGVKNWKPGKYPWELSRHDRLRIDCMLKCINIPKGYSRILMLRGFVMKSGL
jgi:hypothetical protein